MMIFLIVKIIFECKYLKIEKFKWKFLNTKFSSCIKEPGYSRTSSQFILYLEINLHFVFRFYWISYNRRKYVSREA